MPKEQIDVTEFARQVEDLCDYVLDQIKSPGLNLTFFTKVQKLKEKAADLQFINYVHGGSE